MSGSVTKLAIAGAGGRMGRALIESVIADPGLALGAALDVAESPVIGRDAGEYAGSSTGIRVGANIAEAVRAADVLIDFTRPEGTLAHVAACREAKKAIVIGTTGHDAGGLAGIRDAARTIPVVLAPNMAIGVVVTMRLAEIAAKSLGDEFDVEIIEAHHRHKIDAPSGTALKLGELVAGALGRALPEVAVHGRQGVTGERGKKAIGFHALRGGDIVGEHTVIFAGAGERVEVSVRSTSRSTYAAGALRAAKWLRGRAPGLYDMFDVLGMKS